MADSNKSRKAPFSCDLGDDLSQDLSDASAHTGETKVKIICAALRYYLFMRVRNMKKTTASGSRLIERYSARKA